MRLVFGIQFSFFVALGPEFVLQLVPQCVKKLPRWSPKRSTGVQNEGKRHKMEPDGAQKAILSIWGPPGPEKILLLGDQKGAKIDKNNLIKLLLVFQCEIWFEFC